MHGLEISTTSFKDYSPTSPDDGRIGARGQCRAVKRLRERESSGRGSSRRCFTCGYRGQLPQYLATDSEDSEDDEDFTPTIPIRRAAHDDEAGTSGAGAPRHNLRPPTPPPVTVAQVAVSDTLAQILQTLTDQQRRFAEQEDRQAETQARILAEQA